MKKILLYAIGALFLLVSCQSDQLESDDVLIQDNEMILEKAMESLMNYSSPANSVRVRNNPNANQVTRQWRMWFSRGTLSVVPNPGDCGDYDPPLQFLIEGDGLATHVGRFTFTNTACFDPDQGFLTPLLGVLTASAGDQLYFVLTEVVPDPDNENFATRYWDIIGGSEGGRFEDASGWLALYGDSTTNPFDNFIGWGEWTY